MTVLPECIITYIVHPGIFSVYTNCMALFCTRHRRCGICCVRTVCLITCNGISAIGIAAIRVLPL